MKLNECKNYYTIDYEISWKIHKQFSYQIIDQIDKQTDYYTFCKFRRKINDLTYLNLRDLYETEIL